MQVSNFGDPSTKFCRFSREASVENSLSRAIANEILFTSRAFYVSVQLGTKV